MLASSQMKARSDYSVVATAAISAHENVVQSAPLFTRSTPFQPNGFKSSDSHDISYENSAMKSIFFLRANKFACPESLQPKADRTTEAFSNN